ncbi:hypothetical protein [Desulfofustis limnaeus]|uniref:Flagellar protein FlgN n=1 Tax=Desulfofustis limnaeus TaxID=2740163 RepID=A0ABM7W8Z0_9BACT|nr:hypothetical protein [Desulfofustis limnaeus]BDD87373.1 hypothetical protein DPPLL_17380 [Desulfofustis limnaeus]
MKSVDQWLRESITSYHRLAAEAELLDEHLRDLSVADINRRCARLDDQCRDLLAHDEKLHQILTFVGSEVLGNPLLCAYQQALTTAIEVIDRVAVTATRQKHQLENYKRGSGLVF